MLEPGTYARYPSLAGLPALVRKQRRLEARIVPLVPLVEDEKAVRKAIDALLIGVGFARGEGVTCYGYDVIHRDRKGQSSLNPDKVIERLVAEGVERTLVLRILFESTETGDPSQWAEVKPCKGSKVRG